MANVSSKRITLCIEINRGDVHNFHVELQKLVTKLLVSEAKNGGIEKPSKDTLNTAYDDILKRMVGYDYDHTGIMNASLAKQKLLEVTLEQKEEIK